MTASQKVCSQAVVNEIGMTHDPAEDVDHPCVAEGCPYKRYLMGVLWTRPRGAGKPVAAPQRRLPLQR